jgi:tRNA (adenine37-N6)-methyltransferase
VYEVITLDPIAYFHSNTREKADVPRQGVLSEEGGFLEFLPGKNYEQALEDLEGMERVWVVFWMHDVKGWKSKVQPPRAVKKKGVFSTRSPHRPNPIGLSSVKLISVKGRTVYIEEHDLLDGTPILDIKPYLPYADSFPDAGYGWIEKTPPVSIYQVAFSSLAERELSFLEKSGEEGLKKKLQTRLCFLTETSSSNRTVHVEGDFYVMAYKTWRSFFKKEGNAISVLCVFSGYKKEEIEREELFLHREFMERFEEENRAIALSFPFSF